MPPETAGWSGHGGAEAHPLDSFDFTAIPSLNESLELARCEYLTQRGNVIALGNSGPARTALRGNWDWPPARKDYLVGFTTAAARVHEWMEAREGSTSNWPLSSC